MIEASSITAIFDGIAARVHASASPMRTLAVSSTLHKEGTTTIALGMALSLAAFDSSTDVLLVDANWLHPTLSEHSGRSAAAGLAECLRDGLALERGIVRTARRTLSFLPAGQSGTEPPPLGRLATVLEEAQRRYQRIVIDLSPVMVAPSLVVPWANAVDQSYLVMRRAVTPVALIRRAMAEVGGERPPLLILNRSRERAADWGPFQVG
jgi:Mrp family chromosome partitioning ATPase